MSEWQPIETAPKDGTTVLLYHTGAMEPDYVTIAEYAAFDASGVTPCRAGWCSSETGRYVDDSGLPPTHWHPVPDPPSREAR